MRKIDKENDLFIPHFTVGFSLFCLILFFAYMNMCSYVHNVSSKVKDAAKFYDKVDERVNKLIANRTKLTADYLSSIARADTYWFADEGKENGFVDAIIGEDIDIAEIFGFMGDVPCECNHDKCDCKK